MAITPQEAAKPTPEGLAEMALCEKRIDAALMGNSTTFIGISFFPVPGPLRERVLASYRLAGWTVRYQADPEGGYEFSPTASHDIRDSIGDTGR